MQEPPDSKQRPEKQHKFVRTLLRKKDAEKEPDNGKETKMGGKVMNCDSAIIIVYIRRSKAEAVCVN